MTVEKSVEQRASGLHMLVTVPLSEVDMSVMLLPVAGNGPDVAREKFH